MTTVRQDKNRSIECICSQNKNVMSGKPRASLLKVFFFFFWWRFLFGFLTQGKTERPKKATDSLGTHSLVDSNQNTTSCPSQI